VTQQKSNANDYGPAFGPTPTWKEIYDYWMSKGVPQVEVVPFDPATHDVNVYWFEMHLPCDERRGLFYHLQAAPRAETAHALARTVSKGGPGLYAAFALYTTLRQLDEWTPLRDTVQDHLELIAPGLRHSWHTNTKEVLPCSVERERIFRKNRDWHLRVDLAARVWSGLAIQFQVVGKPDLN
jgi:hypothetical protein